VFFIVAAFALVATAQTSGNTSTNLQTTKTTNSQPDASTSKVGIVHDGTLQGSGTSAAPLGVTLPLNLGGSVNVSGDTTVSGNSSVGGNSSVSGSFAAASGIKATTTSGSAVEATGGAGESGTGDGASAVKATGGISPTRVGGPGVEANGGQGRLGGPGLLAHGGERLPGTIRLGSAGVVGIGGTSAPGVEGFGGDGLDFEGGTGVEASGGKSLGTGGSGALISGGNGANGGTGLQVQGGGGDGPGGISGTGIIAQPGIVTNGASNGLAGQFVGDVAISGDVKIRGNLTKGSGSFKIDHPLDPESKYLSHSFVESPDMMNIYNGTITTDAKGNATITLPDWFEALNQDFRYQLTVIGTFAQAIVGQKIKDNRFTVKTSAPNVEVSWQVTGIRHDAYANKHRIAVEERKSEGERGLYLHPDAFNQPESKGIEAAKSPGQTERMDTAVERTGQGSHQ
jgi:hypothetical protein